jgi:glycosyltransferase involved in cell wall biosynthesis
MDLHSQENELAAKKETIRQFSFFYWNWYRLRPFLKKKLPYHAQTLVQQIRARFQPTMYQHPPIPLYIPKQYHDVALPSAEVLPSVSIVTPSFNQGQFLERTIQSVLGQRYPKLEYILMDGASTDETAGILTKYRTQLKQVESRKDAGQANALNLGFRHTTGEIMAWLNSDDLFLPGTLPTVVNFFQQHPEIDVVYGLRISIDSQDREIGRWIIPLQAETFLPWANYIPQETLFWRRRIWEQVGGYIDESFHFNLDWELLLRFQKIGARFARLPRFLGAFRVHSLQKTAVLGAISRQEMDRLHTRYHGRPVEWLEIRYHVRRYLARCVWRYLLYYLGLLRH